MEFNDFRCFVKICRCGSITAAARTLFVSQQALSTRMKKLEAELGLPLFVRSRSGIQLTPFGTQVLDQFEPLIRQYDDALQMLGKERTSLAGHIIFAATPFVFDSLGPDLLTAFSAKHPGYSLQIAELQEGEPLDSSANGGAHFFLVSDADAEQFSSYPTIPLPSCHRNLILHKDHPLAKKKEVHFTDFVDEPLFALNQRMALEDLVNKQLAAAGRHLNILQRGSDPLFFLELINQNKGVMIAAPISSIRSPFDNICQIPIADHFLDFRPAIIYRHAADLAESDKLFIKFIVEHANPRQ